jgi:hypothetical protein
MFYVEQWSGPAEQWFIVTTHARERDAQKMADTFAKYHAGRHVYRVRWEEEAP